MLSTLLILIRSRTSSPSPLGFFLSFKWARAGCSHQVVVCHLCGGRSFPRADGLLEPMLSFLDCVPSFSLSPSPPCDALCRSRVKSEWPKSCLSRDDGAFAFRLFSSVAPDYMFSFIISPGRPCLRDGCSSRHRPIALKGGFWRALFLHSASSGNSDLHVSPPFLPPLLGLGRPSSF